MSCKPVYTNFKPDGKPYAVDTPIPVPFHWEEEVKANLNNDIKDGIIEPVPIGEAIPWCSPMVVTSKKDERPRRTVDLHKCSESKDPAEICKIYQFLNTLKYLGPNSIKAS